MIRRLCSISSEMRGTIHFLKRPLLYISIATNQHIHTITWLNKHQSLGRRGSWDEEEGEEKKKYRRESFLGIYWMAWSLTELDNTWQIQKNKKFSVPPRDPTCMHRKKVVVGSSCIGKRVGRKIEGAATAVGLLCTYSTTHVHSTLWLYTYCKFCVSDGTK